MVALCLLWPASAAAEKRPDTWLSHILLDELSRSAEKGEYESLEARVRTATLERLACGGFESFETLRDMVYVLYACKYLPMAAKLPQGKTLSQWLLEHRTVALPG